MLLDVPRTWTFVGLLCLGRPVHLDTKERRAALHRKPLEQIAFVDRFGNARAWPPPSVARDELDVADAIRLRRAVRRFTDAPIDDATLAALLEAARWAPSAGNFQPWRFVVVRDRAVRESLQRAADLAREANAGLGLAGEPPVDLVRAPAVVAVTADPQKGGPHVHGESTHIVGAALATQNLWLQAAALGLGAVLVRQLVADVARAALGVPGDEDLVGLMAIGEPDESPSPPPRIAADELAREHGFAGHAGEDPGIAPLPTLWRYERGIFEGRER
jgi:5,6-dimethylbenzimidazole synthase